jgi:hypothetical protein
MRKLYIMLLGSMMCLSNQQCNEIDYSDEKFESYSDQQLALTYYAKKAYESKGEERKTYLIKYFKAYPNSFENNFKVKFAGTIPDDLKDWQITRCYGNTLYGVKTGWIINFSRNPFYGTFYPEEKVVQSREEVPLYPVSDRFKEVAVEESGYYAYTEEIAAMIEEEMPSVIPVDILYKKRINCIIGGFQDEYGFEYMIGKIEFKNIYRKILEEYTDDQIASHYYYCCDVPHPDKEEEYVKTYNEIYAYSSRLAEQFKRAYTCILEEAKQGERCTGH